MPEAAFFVFQCVQVVAGCLASVLFAAGICLAGVAAYRRTILRSKNSVI